MNPPRSGYHTGFSFWTHSVFSKISLGARKRMYGVFSLTFSDIKSVVDVGVTSESVSPEANYFEELFPDKSKITAVGIEDAEHLEDKYPGLCFVKTKEGQPLPFSKGQFDVAFSNAVIEHIVKDEDRIQFLNELLRVAKSVFITTPNKYFFAEAHTGVPFLHFLAPTFFYWLLDQGKISKFYNSKNLRLIDEAELRKLGNQLQVPYQITSIRTFGLKSNLILILRNPQ